MPWSPPWWHGAGTVERIHDAPRDRVREAGDRVGWSAGSRPSSSARGSPGTTIGAADPQAPARPSGGHLLGVVHVDGQTCSA
ncbi:hypothetical protein ACFXI0_08380 [Kitasatospora indigofera]|uniref:hypothetical protein n=1 Tax=Kitasatospora indigofera TaxID=67307 RepID=UPI00367BD0AC